MKKKIHFASSAYKRGHVVCGVDHAFPPRVLATSISQNVTCLRCKDFIESKRLKGYKHR